MLFYLMKNNLINKRLNVNPLQQLSVPDIGSVICSPTSCDGGQLLWI